MVTHVAYHHSLASTRGAGVNNDGGDNNMLSLRIKKPLHVFKYNPPEEFTSPIPKKQVIKLPIVKQLPRAITWVFTDRYVFVLHVSFSNQSYTIYTTRKYIYIYLYFLLTLQ